ncbi:unnamed protein product [Protopolystoma xenopodis]|uniref:Uncharacterized protein n=1 Tax=Protopolystoma xenopodis TaxID=117903 RepID=A0A448WJF3_9PLAT|nr:unnamed protein product [Protopolystoma xenopodis]
MGSLVVGLMVLGVGGTWFLWLPEAPLNGSLQLAIKLRPDIPDPEDPPLSSFPAPFSPAPICPRPRSSGHDEPCPSDALEIGSFLRTNSVPPCYLNLIESSSPHPPKS